MENYQTGYFIEEQRMEAWWLKLLLWAVAAMGAGFIAASIWVQLINGQPFGNKPLSNAGLMASDVLVLLAGVVLPLAVMRIRMVVTVDPGRIFINYWPLSKKDIPIARVASWEAQSYSPLRDYGGWGIRYSLTKKAWAYNVGGDRGVLVTLADGKKIMIGSRRADELAEAIGRVRSS